MPAIKQQQVTSAFVDYYSNSCNRVFIESTKRYVCMCNGDAPTVCADVANARWSIAMYLYSQHQWNGKNDEKSKKTAQKLNITHFRIEKMFADEAAKKKIYWKILFVTQRKKREKYVASFLVCRHSSLIQWKT